MKKIEIVKALAEMGITADSKASKAELEAMLTEAQTQTTVNSNGEEFEEYVESFKRVNRISMMPTEYGYLAKCYRTHKLIDTIECRFESENGQPIKHSKEMLEQARKFAIGQMPMNEMYWAPELQAQAWDRKYSKYYTESELEEDCIGLLGTSIADISAKSESKMDIQSICLESVIPTESNLSYVESGRYLKDSAWCCADLVLAINGMVGDAEITIQYRMALKSGQICKPHLTIKGWDAMVNEEMVLCGIA